MGRRKVKGEPVARRSWHIQSSVKIVMRAVVNLAPFTRERKVIARQSRDGWTRPTKGFKIKETLGQGEETNNRRQKQRTALESQVALRHLAYLVSAEKHENDRGKRSTRRGAKRNNLTPQRGTTRGWARSASRVAQVRHTR